MAEKKKKLRGEAARAARTSKAVKKDTTASKQIQQALIDIQPKNIVETNTLLRTGSTDVATRDKLTGPRTRQTIWGEKTSDGDLKINGTPEEIASFFKDEFNKFRYTDRLSRNAENQKASEFAAKTKNAHATVGEKILDGAGYYGEKLGRGIIDGIEGVTDFAWSALGSVGWGVTSGFGLFENDVSRGINKWYNDINNNDITDLFGNAEERYNAAPDWVKNSGWLPETIGNLIPFMAETMSTGGTSTIDDLAVAGKSVWDAGRKLFTNPDVHFGMSAGGNAIEKALEKGANPITATSYGAASGALEVATEKLFGTGYAGTGVGKTAKNAIKETTDATNKTLLKKIWNSPVTRKILDIGTEGIEEDIVTFGDPILQRATGVDANAEWASWSDYVESGTHGVILSVVMNAVGVPINKYGKSRAISRLNESTETLNGLIQNDTLKLQPLPKNATEEEIVKRQKEVSAVALAFDNAVKKAVQNEQASTSDPLEQAAREVVEERNRKSTPLYERLEALSRNNEPITPKEAKEVTGFGTNGSELVAKITNTEGATFYETVAEVKPSYLTGFNNPDMDIKTVAHTFTSPIHEDAYTAGQKDAIMQNTVAEERAKSARVFGADSGVIRDEHSAQYTSKQLRMSDTIGKDLGSQVSFEERLLANEETGYEANAWHRDGEIKISNTSDNRFIEDIMEESLHRMSEINTEAVQVLNRAAYEFVVERERSRGIERATFDEAKALYDNAGEAINTRGIMEEVSVGALATELFRNEKQWLRWREKLNTDSKLRQAWYNLMEFVSEIIEKIERLLADGSFSKETRVKVNKDMADLKRLRGLYADAYVATKDAVAERVQGKKAQKSTDVENNDNFSLKKVEGKNIVWIEESGLTNKQLNNHRAVAEYIEQHIGDVYTIIESGQKVYIGKDLPQEYTQSKYTSFLRDVNQTVARGKNKAIDGFGELIETATNRKWEKTKHTHNKDAKYGMYRYNNSFAFPIKDNRGNIKNVRAFDVELLIRNASDGNKYLYDIVEIEENTTTEIGLLERMTRLPAERQATRDSVSDETIPQNTKTVKNYSLKDSDLVDFGSVKFSLKNKNLTINSRIPFTVLNNYINVANGDQSALSKLVSKVGNLKRGTYKNDATGYRADVNADTIRKAIHPTHKKFNPFTEAHIRNLNAMLKLPELFKKAVYVDSKNPQKAKNKNKAIKKFHHFVAPIFMDNGAYRALITTREKVNSNTLYVLRVEVFPTQKRHTLSAAQQKNAVGSQWLSVPSDISIPDLVNGVKIKNYDTNTDTTYTSADIRFSLKDSEGNDLTEAQQEYFKDSKVRDENGNLLVMYQGASEDFTVFDRKKSSYTNLYGRGFYFTNSENHANQYGKLRAYYLNIKKPVSATETTITKPQLRKFLQAVIENEDYSFENYGYGATVDSVLSSVYGKSDFLMLNDINQTAIGNLVEAVELFNEVNGTEYDGIILDTETVTFNSEQAKLTSNENPTSNPDIRFSLKENDLNKNGNSDKIGEKWHTDLTKAQIKEVEKWLRQVGNPETTKITDIANWYKGRIDGEDLFVIYSTENTDNPTILYEVKGRNARVELDILMDILEDEEYGKSINGKPSFTQRVSQGNWVQDVNSSHNNLRHVGSEQNNQNAGILQGQPQSNGSPAFRNVVKNIFGIQEHGSLNEDKNYSLKGGMFPMERIRLIEDMQKGKKGVAERISKYAKDGVISTELYGELVEKYGAIPQGENPHRNVQVPRETEKNKKVSQTVRTILEAKATPDEAIPTIEKMVEDGIFSYDVYTDKQALNDAEEYIKNYGWDESLDDWFDAINKGEVSKELTTMGWALYNNAANLAATTTSETERTSAIKTSLKILDAMVRHQRSAAQALQATRILKKLSPETQLYGVQKSVSALQQELTDKYGKKAPDLKINEELAEKFLEAKTEEERTEIEKEIYRDIGRQMPANWLDKWNAWRYLSMLGNLRTHGRNILGNAFFAPVVGIKDLTATAIEKTVYRVSGKKTVRGKALVWGSKTDRELLKAAWNDYANAADIVSNGGKYSDSAYANKYIEEGRQIYKFKPLERVRKENSKLLEREDILFSKPHYAFALAQYCKANNITAEQIKRGKAIAPARAYAIKEAQKATYRDTNAFSQMVSEWGRSNNSEKNFLKKATNTVIEGVLPFRKTPANILVRGVEYSPLGMLKGLSYDLYQVSKGKMTASEAIDNISAGLTGTGLLALGVYFAAQELIRGHGEDDEEKKFKELMGHQSYALELPNGQSITLDWLAPEALPFFVGVNIWEATKGSDEEVNLSTILQSVSRISEPMLEMSCLQGLNDLFEGIGYATSNDTSGLVSVVSSAVTSYLSQGIPTLFGQIERAAEEERMTTYTEKNDFLTGDMQYALGMASAKIPFWDYNQIPYIDAWGRKEASGVALKRGFNNFLNPAYTSTIETSDMEDELLRLYEQTGKDGVFPKRADKYFTVDGERIDLTAEEYVRYATLKGEKSYKVISDLVSSKAYRGLDDSEKVKVIEEAYDYANQKAKKAISNYKPESWVNKADGFGANVGNYIIFRNGLIRTKDENDGKISKEEVADMVLDMAQNDSEAWKMYLSEYGSEEALKAQKVGINAKLYIKADAEMYNMSADYIYKGKRVDGNELTADEKKKAKVVSGSRKNKIVKYLNSVCGNEKEYLYLFGTAYGSVKDDYNYIKYFGK